jgi:hypothetical protein
VGAISLLFWMEWFQSIPTKMTWKYPQDRMIPFIIQPPFVKLLDPMLLIVLKNGKFVFPVRISSWPFHQGRHNPASEVMTFWGISSSYSPIHGCPVEIYLASNCGVQCSACR